MANSARSFVVLLHKYSKINEKLLGICLLCYQNYSKIYCPDSEHVGLFCLVSGHRCIDTSHEEVRHEIRAKMASYTSDFVKKDWKYSIK